MSEREGGAAWEARKALKAVRLAQQSGDKDAEDLAWLRYAEALTNASYSGAAAAFLGILEVRDNTLVKRLETLAGERKEETVTILGKLKELHEGQALMRDGFQEVGERLNTLDTRHREQWQHAIEELQHLRASLEESRQHRARLQAQVDTIEGRLLPDDERARLIQEHTEDRAWLRTFDQRLTALEERVRQLREANP